MNSEERLLDLIYHKDYYMERDELAGEITKLIIQLKQEIREEFVHEVQDKFYD